MMRTLSNHEHGMLLNALRVAAEVYAADARTMDNAGIERLADQFRKQRVDALRLMESLEDCDAMQLIDE